MRTDFKKTETVNAETVFPSRVFVYGTLKSGQPNHHLLSGSKRLMTGWTAKRYRMFCNGWFPMIVPDQSGYFIFGEVYEVSPETLQRLDRLEGVPNHYYRDSCPVVDLGVNRMTAYVYVYSDARVTSELTEVPAGRWNGATFQ
jgi:gamma-glutamylaminecyclotransferase